MCVCVYTYIHMLRTACSRHKKRYMYSSVNVPTAGIPYIDFIQVIAYNVSKFGVCSGFLPEVLATGLATPIR